MFQHHMHSRLAVLATLVVSTMTGESQGDAQFFNAASSSAASTTRGEWLAAIGIATPQHLLDFETGFIDNQNISGVTGVCPAQLVVVDSSSAASAIIRTGAGVVGGSNPVGQFCVTHNEEAYLVLDFAARPVDYLGVRDIDTTGTTIVITFADATTVQTSIETTGSSGNTAEFFGVFRNDKPRITRIQFDANGDGVWGLDDIEYGLTCPADINDDGAVNVADLLATITTWGPCPLPPTVCLGDVAPSGGDGQVNVADLLSVITNWGPCP